MVVGGLISTLPVTKDIEKLQPKSEEELNCEAKGGTWDDENQVCILPEPKPVPKVTPPKIGADIPETFTDPKSGRASGIEIAGTGKYHIPTGKVLPDGSNETKRVGIEEYNVYRRSIGVAEVEDRETYLGLNPEDVSDVAAGEAARVARPEGTAPVGSAAAESAEQFRIQQQIAQIGQLGQLNPAVQADINFSQALTAGGAKILPAAAGGAAVGATAGLLGGPLAPVTSTVGAIILGAAGAATGFVGGILGNIKEQQRGELQAADIELTNGRTNMRQLAMLASQDPSNADIYIKQYNDQLTRIHQSRRQTKAEVTGNLNSFMEDGREQLADFDAFLQPGGIADIYGQKLAIALSSDTPLSINGEGLLE